MIGKKKGRGWDHFEDAAKLANEAFKEIADPYMEFI